MKKNIAPKARTENLVIQEIDNETLIYDLDTNKVFQLNETSSVIWQACDGHNGIPNISDKLKKQFGSAVNDDFVWLALDQLNKENLIENRGEIDVDFNGLSRREVIRKVGLGTVLSLPLITSLFAPLPIQAASLVCTATSCTCTQTVPTALVPCRLAIVETNPCTETGCVCTSDAGTAVGVGIPPPGTCRGVRTA